MPYIYILCDPCDGQVRYVGKADDVNRRMSLHLGLARKCHKTYCARWIRSLLLKGESPIVDVIEEVAQGAWVEAEKRWIAYYRDSGAPLTNMTVGGDGAIPLDLCEDEFRRRISEGVRRKGLDPEWRKSLGKSTRGKHLSAEWRAKIGAANKGKIIPPEAIAKAKATRLRNGNQHPPMSEEGRRNISKALKGRKCSEEHKAHLSAARKGKKGRVFSKAHRDSLSRSLKGRKTSDEARAKMSAAKQGWSPSEKLRKIQREKCSGEGNGRAKLTDSQVCEMRTLYMGNPDRPTYASIGEKYGVTFGVVFRILRGKSWKHLLS